MKRYSIEVLRHSKEPLQKKKTFVNLDGKKIGIEFNDELTMFRYFLYEGKKKNGTDFTPWYSVNIDIMEIRKALFDLVKSYYKKVGRLNEGELPMYTRMELAIYPAHLSFHAQAGTLGIVPDKEIIYN